MTRGWRSAKLAPHDPRHRPGHDGHDLPRLRRRGASSSGAPTASSSQHFPRPGWVEHDAAEIWDVTQAVARRGARRRRRRRRRAARRSASRTSARPSACGTPRPASRCIARSSGRTAAPPSAATSCARPATSALVRAAHRPRPRPVLLGDEDRVAAGQRRRPARAGARRRAAFGTIDAWLVFKLTGEHAHRRLQRLAHDALRHPRAALGRRAARAVRRAPRARCPRCARASASSGTTRAERAGTATTVAGGGDRRRPAGGAVRPGAASSPGLGKNTYGTGSFVLLNSGDAAPDAARRACWRPSPGGSASAWTTRWRRRSS